MGQELWGLSSGRLNDVRREIGFIFQAHNLFASLTAMQNVRMAMELFPHGEQEMKRRTEEMLARLGLGNYYVGNAITIHHGGRSSTQQTVSQWATRMKFRAMMIFFRVIHATF